MSERVDIWTVVLDDDQPVLLKGSALVSAKRVRLVSENRFRFGHNIEYATKGNGETFGIGARSDAPDHWFSVEAALKHWEDYVRSQVSGLRNELATWSALQGVDPSDDGTPDE